jgi:hypothetical protein
MTDEIENPELPEGVGPHEGRELELMLAGKKPLAMFSEAIAVPVSDLYPEEEFMSHVASGTFIRRDKIYQPHNLPMAIHVIYYALPNEAWRIDELDALQSAFATGGRDCTEDDERSIGHLLGYSEREISTFIEWCKVRRRTLKTRSITTDSTPNKE